MVPIVIQFGNGQILIENTLHSLISAETFYYCVFSLSNDTTSWDPSGVGISANPGWNCATGMEENNSFHITSEYFHSCIVEINASHKGEGYHIKNGYF